MRVPEENARRALLIAAVLAMALLAAWTRAEARTPGQAGRITAGTAVPLAKAKQTGEISGLVTDATTGKPIAGARVMIFGRPPAGVAGGVPAISFEYPCVGCGAVGKLRYATTTDAKGRYRIRVATPRWCFVRASASGYAGREFRPAKSRYGWTGFQVRPGETRRDVNIQLPPGAVLTGRVTDEHGEAIPSAYILVEWHGISGWERNMWLPVIMVVTDDRGVYRVWGLPPGSYRINMRYVPGLLLSTNVPGDLGYALFTGNFGPIEAVKHFSPLYYYPGVAEAADAKTITLTPGRVRRRVNISVPAAAVAKPVKPTETGECEMSGTVTDAKTGKPLANAWVAWGSAGQSAGPGNIEARADAEGKFAFHSLPCNVRAPLRAWKPGYVLAFASPGSLYGQQWPPPSPFARVRSWDVKNLTLALTREGVITGEVTNPQGRPAAWVRVEVARFVRPIGHGSYLSECCEAMTDDRGKYRIFGLEPGQYYVEAQFRRGPDLGGVRYSMGGYLYYPGWVRLDAARAIRVRAGETVNGIDFAGKLPRMYSVSGVVQGDARNEIGRGLNVFLQPVRSSSLQGRAGAGLTKLDSSGKFRITDVLPGEYMAWAQAFVGGEQWAAWAPVTVTRKDVTDVALDPVPGWDIAGELKVEGSPNGHFLYRVMAKPVGGFGSPVAGASARVASDGKFELKGIFPGHYRISMSAWRVHKFWPRPGGPGPWVPAPLTPPPNDYLKAATFGKQNVRTGVMRVGTQGPSGILKLTVSWNGAVVEGTVTNAAGEPAKDAMVVLVPEKRLRGAYWLIRMLGTYSKGRYLIPGVAPGRYRVVAIRNEDLGSGDVQDALREGLEKAKRVVVKEGQKLTVNVREME